MGVACGVGTGRGARLLVASSSSARRRTPRASSSSRRGRAAVAARAAGDGEGGVAGEGGSEAVEQVTHGDALKLLGVREGAGFDEILRAKNRLLAKHAGDDEKLKAVDQAYDVLLMVSLSQRQSGKVADSAVRWADARRAPPPAAPPPWAAAARRLAPGVEAPDAGALAQQGAVFGGLAAWTLVQGATTDVPGADVPGAQLALGVGASVWYLRQKNVGLGRAAALTAAGLVAGSLVGGAAEAFLRVDVVPIGSFDSPAALVSEFALGALFAASAFLY